LASSQFDVFINEIAWMGTQNSANDEWLELKNNTAYAINLSGWILQSADEKLKINLSGIILPNNFYLLERTDDNSAPNIKADQIYSGALSNTGDDLWLYDANNSLIDEANFTEKWQDGDNATKQTMERTDKDNWQTSTAAGGTPKFDNSEIRIPKSETNLNSQNSNIQNATPVIYPRGVFINEVMPNPEGADETEEWIEIYNSNNFDVDLSGWKIEDTTGTKSSFLINRKIPLHEYLVFKRPETKILLNNEGDGLNLLTPDGKSEDSMFFTKAPLGQSYNKTISNWQWSKDITPGKANIILAGTNSNDLPKTENSVKNNNIEAGVANVSLSMQAGQNNPPVGGINPWALFFTALAITIVSALAVLFIKLKLQKNVGT